MHNGTLFYISGGALAVSAVLVSFLGLRLEKFPGRLAPVVFVWFAVLVGAATTFSVLHAQDEEEAKAAESTAESETLEAEEDEAVDAGADGAGHGAAPGPQAKGPGGTLELAADPTKIAFDKTSLSSKPGKVTIEFDNPSAIEHDVAIEKDGEEIAASALIVEGETSVTAELPPGTYTFLCTVPGHAEAGMEGTLTVR